jgi:hypothetical protein
MIAHDLLYQNTRLFLFLFDLWIYLWLAKTSQQPINQTTWLKVTPHLTVVTIGFKRGKGACSNAPLQS